MYRNARSYEGTEANRALNSRTARRMKLSAMSPRQLAVSLKQARADEDGESYEYDQFYEVIIAENKRTNNHDQVRRELSPDQTTD